MYKFLIFEKSIFVLQIVYIFRLSEHLNQTQIHWHFTDLNYDNYYNSIKY